MNWYAAHAILFAQFKEGKQTKFPVWENLLLVKARTEAEAFKKAEKRARQDEGDDGGSFRWDGKPARWVFAGIRKLTLCQDADERPDDGTEISYQEMLVESEASIQKLVAGQEVVVRYSAEFDESPSRKQVG